MHCIVSCKRKVVRLRMSSCGNTSNSLIYSMLLIPSHSFMTDFCSVATSISAPLPLLYASCVNEATMAWSIMRFIFSSFLCTALPKVWMQVQSVKEKKVIFFQIHLLNTNDSFLQDFWFWSCQGDQHWAGFCQLCLSNANNDQFRGKNTSIVDCVLLKNKSQKLAFKTDEIKAAFLYFVIQNNVRMANNYRWSCIKCPYPQWWHQKNIRLEQHNMLLILRSHEAAFCQIEVESSSRWVASPSI